MERDRQRRGASSAGRRTAARVDAALTVIATKIMSRQKSTERGIPPLHRVRKDAATP